MQLYENKNEVNKVYNVKDHNGCLTNMEQRKKTQQCIGTKGT